MHQELELLVESGLSPAEALRCATLHNASALGQADRLGTIERGKLADLVLLDANPLNSIGCNPFGCNAHVAASP
jgi:imidazolonepropionase-like amidohydrolase